MLYFKGNKYGYQNIKLSGGQSASKINIQDFAVKANGLKTLLAQIWCWLTGGTWKDGLYDGLGSNGEVFMAGCDPDADDNEGGNYGEPGNYYEGNPGSINYNNSVDIGGGITIGGLSYGDGTAWVIAKQGPLTGCGPDGTEFQDPDSGCSIQNNWEPYGLDQSSFSGYSTYDTYTGDDDDDPNETNTANDNPNPKSHIPHSITLNSGNKVDVFFGVTKDQLSADQLVDSRLITALISTLNIAESNGGYIYSIYIKATTNGGHSTPKTNHQYGTALDISMINGIPIIVQHSSVMVRKFQQAFDQLSNARENFGPYFKHKFTSPYSIGGHDDHIHISINL